MRCGPWNPTDPRVAAAIAGIERHRQVLPRVAPIFSAAELADTSAAGRANIVKKLRRHLREDRRRGLAGHWAYSPAVHAAAHRAYQAEMKMLTAAHAAVADTITTERA